MHDVGGLADRNPTTRGCRGRHGSLPTILRLWDKMDKNAQKLGWSHQKRRRDLLPLAYGKECPLCGCVMLEGMALELDHVVPRAMGGMDGPVRITHARCNRAAGARLRNLMYGNNLNKRVRSRW